jgi:hypothetical protein
MKEGYYKIVDVEYVSGDGSVRYIQNIQYYDDLFQHIITEHYIGSIRPEYNVPLPEDKF